MGKVVFTAAIFDLLHKGHLNLLRKMRKEAGKNGLVIVVLHNDKSCFDIKDKFPIQDLQHRTRNVMLSGLVNAVVATYDTEPDNEFRSIILQHSNQELLFMRGDDNKSFPAKDIIDTYEIPIKYVPYTKGVSSTKLRGELI
jgi:cytidyltransferase-like protein